jgi:iron complex outermembrane recepter protein
MSMGALMSAEASAQSSTFAQDVTASDSSDLGEVVVTAQKRSERLVDVPISISVVSPEILASTNSKNLNELSGAVPGIQFNGNGGGGRTYISLRGTTGSALNTGDEPDAT